MPKANFGFGEESSREYFAEHDGVNWRERLVARADEEGVDLPKPFWYEAGDVTLELHEDNCYVFMSQADDTLDCVRIEHGDGGYTIYWREEFADDRFDTIVENLGLVATLIMRPTPAKGLQDLYEAEKLADIRSADFVPTGWEQ